MLTEMRTGTPRCRCEARTTEGPNPGPQQLRLVAKALQPARSLAARRLDARQALLAALPDRDQLGLDLPTASTARRMA